jgi:hypothetical protein
LKVVNSCARAHGNRRIARDDLLDQAAHGLDAQRQRDHVQQQPVVAGGAVTGQQVGLDRGAQRHHLVRVDVRVRDGLEEVADGAADVRHARGAADHHDAVDVFHRGTSASRMALRTAFMVLATRAG